MLAEVVPDLSCRHCGELALRPTYHDCDVFCCNGCKAVYQILNSQGLDNFYKIKTNSEYLRKPLSLLGKKEKKYDYLDQEKFIADYAVLDNHNLTMSFFVEGMHCRACYWLINKLSDFVIGINRVNINLSQSTLDVTLKVGYRNFSQAATQLQQWGYVIHPLKSKTDAKKFKDNQRQTELMRIGVAAACMGNMMLFSVSLYAGVDGFYKRIFELLSALLFIPVLFYSAQPFFKNTINSFNKKLFSMDIPIALAMLLGAFYGCYYLVTGVGELYFDTLTTLVFLVLLSRFILSEAQQKGLDALDLMSFFSYQPVKKKSDNSFEPTCTQYLKRGDIINIEPQGLIPVDGKVIEGRSYIDSSFLTGESLPQEVSKNSSVLAGMRNMTNEILIQVDELPAQTQLAKILKTVDNDLLRDSQFIGFSEKYVKILISFCLILSLSLLAFFYSSNFIEGQLRALAVLIITCPCALGLITPLVFSNAIKIAAKKGILIRNANVFEKMAKIKNIFLDKTGTITEGNFAVEKINNPIDKDTMNIIYSLESRSSHPIAKSITDYFLTQSAEFISISDYKEIIGKGVEGKIRGDLWEVKSTPIEKKVNQDFKTEVGIYKNAKLLCIMTLQDRIRENSYSVIKSFKKKFEIFILSGDKASSVLEVAKKMEIPPRNCFWEKAPHEKREIIAQSPHSLMLGDGINDAPALAQAEIGIATQGNADINLKASEVFFFNPGIESLKSFYQISNYTIKQIKFNIFVTFLYNIVGITLATLGLLGPLGAAISMPLSSLSVLGITYIGQNKLNKRLHIL